MIFKKDYQLFTSKLNLYEGQLPLWKNFITFADGQDFTLSVWGYESFLKKALKEYRKYAKNGSGIESFAEYINQKYPPYNCEESI